MSAPNVTLDKGGRRKWNKDVYAVEYFEGQWNGSDAPGTQSREDALRQLDGQRAGVLSKRRGGLYCEVCNKSFKDSVSFTTHLNSPEHTGRAGVQTAFRAATADDVKTRLALLKEKDAERKESPAERERRLELWRSTRKQRKREWRMRQMNERKRRQREHQNEMIAMFKEVYGAVVIH